LWMVSICGLDSYHRSDVLHLNSYLQLGISDHSRLGMECYSRAPPTQVDDMGL